MTSSLRTRLFPSIGMLIVAAGATVALGQGSAPKAAVPTAYLGQEPPGSVARLFAPGIVSTGLSERDLAITPDGREIYWTVTVPGGAATTTIVCSKLAGGRWTPPEVMAGMTDPSVMHIEPAISPDGKRFFFTRAARKGGRIVSASILVMERQGDGWGEPRDLGAPINGSGRQFFASPTRDGSLYFTREQDTEADGIYRSRLVDGRYTEPVRLPAQVNTGAGRYNAFVDPEERFIIVPVEGRKDSVGGTDYYVSFRHADDTWSEPVNLGPAVNTLGAAEYSPYVSPDGKYLFFMSARGPATPAAGPLTYRFFRDLLQQPQNGTSDIYWIDADVITKLRR